ncbi:MAG: hypothetical protein WAM14_01100 [Candidatus Nitrosopolaris sp.]
MEVAISENAEYPCNKAPRNSSTIGLSMVFLLYYDDLVIKATARELPSSLSLETDKAIQKGKYIPKHSAMYAASISLVIFSTIIIAYLFSLQ